MSEHANLGTPAPASACTMVIFGAGGDLTARLLLPALCNLFTVGLLPHNFALVGIARAAKTEADFRNEVAESLSHCNVHGREPKDKQWLIDRCHYLQGDFTDPETYKKLAILLGRIDEQLATGGNYLFYLATPPTAFVPVVNGLGQSGLSLQDNGRWRRVVVEKPFGTDLASARELNTALLSVLDETQIYRIDHFLGKETVQNILVFRFGNGIFEPLWNRNHIDHVQITVAETVGVEQRGRFYDQTGALRDMVPNHLFQLLALIGMEPPSRLGADAMRLERGKVFAAIRQIEEGDVGSVVVRGQYGTGTIDGKTVLAYRDAPNVARQSNTETYVALKLLIDNWRWEGVPFYLRTGKALTQRRSEIAIQFKRAPLALFRDSALDQLAPNDLVLHIQPEESVTMRFGAKIPGPQVKMGPVAMRFNYSDYFKAVPNTGYETLLYDCMVGDASLFQSAENIEDGWRAVQPILEAWAQTAVPLAHYPAGSEGPAAAAALLARDGRGWRSILRPKP